MVEGGFLNKKGGGKGLVLVGHGIVLCQESPNEVVVESVMPTCRSGFKKGDTVLVRKGGGERDSSPNNASAMRTEQQESHLWQYRGVLKKMACSLFPFDLTFRLHSSRKILRLVESLKKGYSHESLTPQTVNGIKVTKVSMVHKQLAEDLCPTFIEVSRGSGRVQEVCFSTPLSSSLPIFFRGILPPRYPDYPCLPPLMFCGS